MRKGCAARSFAGPRTLDSVRSRSCRPTVSTMISTGWRLLVVAAAAVLIALAALTALTSPFTTVANGKGTEGRPTVDPTRVEQFWTKPSAVANQGLATNRGVLMFRGDTTIPADLRGQGWSHVGDPDARFGYVLDAYQSDMDAKLFTLTSPTGRRIQIMHRLAAGEMMNNSFATIAPDGRWFVSGEWDTVRRLLVFPMPGSFVSEAIDFATTIELDAPVDRIQGCDFATSTRLFCGADDYDDGATLMQIDLPHKLDGRAMVAHVTSLGVLPLRGGCPVDHLEAEGIDVDGDELTVSVVSSACKSRTTIYRYAITPSS